MHRSNRHAIMPFRHSVATYLRSKRALVELFSLLLNASLLNGLRYIALRLLSNDSEVYGTLHAIRCTIGL